jgi:hypothetical protein
MRGRTRQGNALEGFPETGISKGRHFLQVGIVRGLEERRKIVGDFELNVAFRFGGTPYEVAERGLKLFAKEVLPVLKSASSSKVREAAE